VAVFGSERKSGKRNCKKKKQVCLKNWKLELQTESEFYDGRRFGRKLVELVGWSAEQSNKASQKQVIT
jgi:hypothetical protein